jgi:DNA polymerase III epsilon subunit-like protein
VDIPQVVIFDLETDGPDPKIANILEIGAILMDLHDGSIVNQYESLVLSDRPIPPEISSVNHITELDLKNTGVAGGIVTKEFFDFVAGRPVVAHNAKFDLEGIENCFGLTFDHTCCTMRLAKHLLPDLGNYGLQFLRYKLGIDVRSAREVRAKAHTALCDAKLTGELLYYLWRQFWRDRPKANYYNMESLSWSVIEIPLCPFPKHKGKPWPQVPKGYISWILDNLENLDSDLRATMKKYL